MIHQKYYELKEKQDLFLNRKNEVDPKFYNGIYDRYVNPVLTRDTLPIEWQYDLNAETNPYFEERLGINAVMNSGALYLNGKYYLVARIEGNDRKSFFGVAESDNGVDGFKFWDYPVVLPDTCPEETNVYDMRLTRHEDGYIYGVFCSESKDDRKQGFIRSRSGGRHCAHQGLKYLGKTAELKDLAFPPAEKCSAASRIRGRQICVLYKTHG